MKIHRMDQRSWSWHEARLGVPTASQAHRIITPNGAPSKQARPYIFEKIYERIFRRPVVKDLSGVPHVQEGIKNEEFAAEQFIKDVGFAAGFDTLEKVGFVTTDDGKYGCSPDRIIVGTNAALEIKCPTGPKHIGYLIDGTGEDYRAQVQMQLMVGLWDCVHFYSWNPEMAAFYTITHPDPGFQAKLWKLLVAFDTEVTNGERYVRSKGVWPKNEPSTFPEPENGEFPF